MANTDPRLSAVSLSWSEPSVMGADVFTSRFARADGADAADQPLKRGVFELDFDELGYDVLPIPANYGASYLEWSSNWDFENRQYTLEHYIDTPRQAGGLYSGAVSGDNVLWDVDGNVASIQSNGPLFDLTSLYLTSAWRNGMNIEIQGFAHGKLIYDVDATVNVKKPLFVSLDWHGVDSVVFTPTGGKVAHDVYGITTGFVADNIVMGGAGSIRGVSYDDANSNGMQDRGEKGLRGVTLYVDANRNGVLDSGEQSTVTGKGGHYTLKTSIGTYTIAQVVPDGYHQTSPTEASYDLSSIRYHWVDIASEANRLSFLGADPNDDGEAQIELSRPIDFYGHAYSTMYVTTNGFITFDPLGYLDYNNQQIPTNDSPNALIAPFWDDLSLGSAGAIYFKDDSAHGRYIIEYDHVSKNGEPGSDLSFEVIVNADGSIKFNYGSLTNLGNSATIGVENENGTHATQISYDSASLAEHSSYLLTPSRSGDGATTTVIVDAGQTASANFGNQADDAGAVSVQPVASTAFVDGSVPTSHLDVNSIVSFTTGHGHLADSTAHLLAIA